MLGIFAIVFLLAFLVCRHALGRYEQVLRQGAREAAPTAHTGAEIARLFFASEGITDVEIVEHEGMTSNCFDPRRRRLFLTRETAGGATLAAWAVALHEAGHAAQTGEALGDVKWRQTVIRLTRYGPGFAVILAGALMLMKFNARMAVFACAGLCLAFLLLNLGTLAVEFNANARLRRFLEKHLERHHDALERLGGHLSKVATREVGDLLRSPRFFLLSGLPGSGKIRPKS
ncbi:MAG TPA: zinc metallopeptidase [Prosthecobacter sp.]|nr:zinc metallopeptidase [Prosthecobacter sp.]HRK14934.1 zinc metallopeptidase [Prosthecobacter sp.]